jgi:hypothetical protein
LAKEIDRLQKNPHPPQVVLRGNKVSIQWVGVRVIKSVDRRLGKSLT